MVDVMYGRVRGWVRVRLKLVSSSLSGTFCFVSPFSCNLSDVWVRAARVRVLSRYFCRCDAWAGAWIRVRVRPDRCSYV